MKLAVLETSVRAGAVALAEGPKLLASQPLPADRKQGRDLIPTLQRLLADVGWTPTDVDALIVDVGPGSYTGLRVGLMTIKTWAYALGRPVVAIDAMTALTASAPADWQSLWTIVDAQQGLLYVSSFQWESHWRRTLPLTILPTPEWIERLLPTDWITGPGIEHARSWLSPAVRLAPVELREPTVAGLLAIGWPRCQQGAFDDPWTFEPLYLRASSAETKWDARQASVSRSK